MFGVQVPAPHGGFLVLPVVTGKFQWVFSILIGSIIGGVILGLIQKSSVAAKEKKANAEQADKSAIAE